MILTLDGVLVASVSMDQTPQQQLALAAVAGWQSDVKLSTVQPCRKSLRSADTRKHCDVLTGDDAKCGARSSCITDGQLNLIASRLRGESA